MSDSEKISQLSEIDRFYHIFGKALAAWANIEWALAMWFKACTGLDYDTAINLFFSGKSFNTRTDLLLVSMETAKIADAWREFIFAARKKALGYSSSRNVLAHGLVYPSGSESDERGHPTKWLVTEPSKRDEPGGIHYDDIVIIARNFDALSSLLRVSYIYHTRAAPPEEYLRQLHELPNEAGSTELSQKQKARGYRSPSPGA
jgi:hypothetical protein